MDLKEEYFNSFSKKDFEILLNCLNTQGYVIDGKDENGITFSSVQIEHMSQNMFDKLCLKYSFESNIIISTTGNYYPEEGAYYIVFNEEYYEYSEAKIIMDNYVLKGIEKYQDLYIDFEKDALSVITQISDNLSENWSRNLKSEQTLNNIANIKQYCFSLNTPKQQYCNLWLIERDGQLTVSNIVPNENNQLTIQEYNRILNYFVTENIDNTPIKYHITKNNLYIEDILGESIAKKFKKFSRTSNMSTGHSHPSDEKKWLDFLYSMISEEKYLSTDELIYFLTRDGWNEETAFDLALDMEYGITLMKYAKNGGSDDL